MVFVIYVILIALNGRVLKKACIEKVFTTKVVSGDIIRATIIGRLADVLIVYQLNFSVETNFITDTVDVCNRI